MIKFRVRGLEEFKGYIDSLQRNLRGKATEWVSDWLIGNGSRGLKHYPPYKYVTRKSAYGQTFQSDKQRRYVMARIADGTIDPGAPHRTGRLQRGWTRIGSGVRTRIVNEEPHALYVMDTQGQARQPAKVGWRKVAEIISTNIRGAVRHAESMIKTLKKG